MQSASWGVCCVMRFLRRSSRVVAVLLSVALFASACGQDLPELGTEVTIPAGLPDPTDEGPVPDGYRKSFDRDGIMPVYSPVLVPASGVDWGDDELIIGVEIDGDARAYPCLLYTSPSPRDRG